MKWLSSKYLFNVVIPIVLAIFPLLGMALLEGINLGITKVLYLLIFIGFFGYILKNPKIIFPLYAKLLFVFFIYIFFSDIILIGRQINISYFFLNKFLLFLVFLVLMENIQIDVMPERLILNLIKIVSIIAAIVIIVQVKDPFFLVKKVNDIGEIEIDIEDMLRYKSIYSYVGKQGILFVFIPSLGLVIADELKRNKTASLLFWILIGAIVSFLSGTRVVMVNMILLLVMVFIYKGTSMVNILKYFVFFILAIISFVLVMEVAKVDYNRIITDRILTENDGGLVEGSGGTRILAFELFPQFFMKSPIWGSGSEISLDLKNKLDGRSSQLHVGYLSYLYYFGLVGGLLYFLFMFYYSRKLFINAKIHKNWGPFFGWIGFPIANLTLNYMAPFEAGILLCVLFDRYYLICSKNKCQHTLR